MNLFRRFLYVGILSSLTIDLIPSLAILATLFFYSYLGGSMKASIIFTVLQVYYFKISYSFI